MSNYAPNPIKEKVYDNLQNKTLGTVEASDIQTLTDPTFIQATNQDALITYNMINKAMMRDGSPMPNTMVMQEVTVTDNTGTAMLTCPKGQVLQVLNYGYKATGSTGTLTFTAFMGPKGQELTSEQGGIRILYYQSSAATPVINSDADYRALSPLIIDENFQLGFTLGGSYTSATIRVFAVRVR